MLQAIVFDLDGTLLHTIEDLSSAGNFVLHALGMPRQSTNAFARMVGDGIPRLVARMLPESRRDEATVSTALRMFRQRYAGHYNDATRPYPGVPELLRYLRRRGLRLAVVSNKADAYTQALIEAHFPGMFELVLGQTGAFSPKPCADILLYTLRLLGVSRNASAVVGDSVNDAEMAQYGGVSFFGVGWGYGDSAMLARMPGTLVADDPGTLYTNICRLF